MRLTTGASKEAVNLDYLKPLRNAITRPLITAGTEGIHAAIDVMNQYHLLRLIFCSSLQYKSYYTRWCN